MCVPKIPCLKLDGNTTNTTTYFDSILLIQPSEISFEEEKMFLPICKYPSRFPSTHDCSIESHHESRAVKQHVESVRDQTQAVSPYPIHQFHESEHLKEVRRHIG